MPIDYLGWNYDLLLHPPGPYRLVVDDGLVSIFAGLHRVARLIPIRLRPGIFSPQLTNWKRNSLEAAMPASEEAKHAAACILIELRDLAPVIDRVCEE